MKMHPNDFARLKSYCGLVMQRDSYPDVVADYKARGLSDMRLRWDVLHASKFPVMPLYSYLNDSHIDTALKAIVQGVQS